MLVRTGQKRTRLIWERVKRSCSGTEYFRRGCVDLVVGSDRSTHLLVLVRTGLLVTGGSVCCEEGNGVKRGPTAAQSITAVAGSSCCDYWRISNPSATLWHNALLASSGPMHSSWIISFTYLTPYLRIIRHDKHCITSRRFRDLSATRCSWRRKKTNSCHLWEARMILTGTKWLPRTLRRNHRSYGFNYIFSDCRQ